MSTRHRPLPLPHPNCYALPYAPVLAGEYPFTQNPETAREKLCGFLDAGVTSFIDLTEPGELDPYEEVLRAEAETRGAVVEYLRFPIPDMRVPSRERMCEVLDAIDAACAAGRTVYLHCWGGVGRTGTVVGCWLVRGGATGEAALRQVGEFFRTMSAAKVRRFPEGSPQTERQRDFVRRWTEVARARGALLGLAVGDAVGTTVEFRAPGSFAPVTDMVGGGPFGLAPGQWTDDTSMALCLAESLVERGGFDARDQMERYVRWYREGYNSSTGRCFDIGNTVRTALHRFERSGEPFAGSTDPYSAGNGSLMRLAPVALRWADAPEEAIRLAGDSSRTTHGARAAVDACRYFAGLLVGVLNGASKEELLSERYTPVPGLWDREPLVHEIDEIAAGSFLRRDPPDIRGSGYVVHSLEAALWAFARTDTFAAGVLAAVNLGEDADTTAAIYGQIAGVYYGESGIPTAWRERLHDGERIGMLASRLLEAAGS